MAHRDEAQWRSSGRPEVGEGGRGGADRQGHRHRDRGAQHYGPCGGVAEGASTGRQGQEYGWSWALRQGWASPYLFKRKDPVDKENRVLGYLAYLGWLEGSAAAIKQVVFAIKDAHKRAGHGDPTADMHRVWMLVSSVERHAVRKLRRLGVTVDMLQWLGAYMAEGEQAPGEVRVDCRMLQAAMSTAWFFMRACTMR